MKFVTLGLITLWICVQALGNVTSFRDEFETTLGRFCFLTIEHSTSEGTKSIMVISKADTSPKYWVANVEDDFSVSIQGAIKIRTIHPLALYVDETTSSIHVLSVDFIKDCGEMPPQEWIAAILQKNRQLLSLR